MGDELEVARTEEEGMRIEEEEEEEEERGEGSSGLNDGLVRWENLLPKMVLRVLLVEADDSTRQIISALLRKCSYRVSAVRDGLKAWEVLKGRPHDIDLILTEVELPSISGYALLTLIAEHDVCKNIPVIMMSSEDSVNTVYKCMLRGAADYLVKPIRRNELRNLWQHVWRRQSSIGGSFPLGGSSRQDTAEGSSENNAASNNANRDVGSIERSKEYIEKQSDAQSSCTKREAETESAQVADAQDLVQPLRGEIPNDKDIQTLENQTGTSQQLCMHEDYPWGSSAAAYTSSFVVVSDNAEAENQRLKDVEAREAIDFMGTCNVKSSSNNANCKLQSSPNLDLTLRGSHFGGFNNQIMEERNMLRPSSASAFTRYSSKGLQFFPAVSAAHQNEPGGTSNARMTINDGAQMSSTLGQVPITRRSSGQTKESDPTTSLQQRVIPIQDPMESMTFDKLCSSHGSVFPPMFCKQSSSSPTPSPSSIGQQESTPRASGYHYSTNKNSQKEPPVQKLETQEDNWHISPATDQSAHSSFCNGSLTRMNSMGHGSACGSSSNLDQVGPVRAAEESKNEENVFGHDQNSHRSSQREAALLKFRMKRKDRCFEKKVRYESRKKLAEQRPRVKGQFVRQLHVDHPSAETS